MTRLAAAMKKGRWAIPAVALALLGAGAAAGCGRPLSAATSNSGNINPTANLITTTQAGSKPVASITWALYRDVNSLDPAFAFDYPENTSISLMCESLLRQQPSGSITSGLATMAIPNPTTLVFTIKPGARFWDGHPVTPEDVVYSLDRQMSVSLGGFYTTSFNRVKTIEATGANQVTINLSQPDYWLPGELASMGGVIVEKAFAQRAGKNYGTPAGGIMCTGSYEYESWNPSAGVVAVVNPHYWGGGKLPLVRQIILKGVADNNALTAGLETGAIQGTYSSGGIPTLQQLRDSPAVTVYQGPGWASDAMVISATRGPAADVKVREAISLALNRQSLIDAVYRGAALMPRWLANPGSFGYGTAAFDRYYAASPVLNQNVAEARRLVREAGAAGQTITIGTSSEVASIAIETGVFQQAAEAAGLKVALKSVSANDFINFFTDPAFRQGVDMFPTTNYGDYAGPEGLLATLALPHETQNYDNYGTARMTALLEGSRSTADPDARAALMAQAEQLAVRQMLWIPAAQPTQVLIMSRNLTGAVASFAYMFAPWADTLGGR